MKNDFRKKLVLTLILRIGDIQWNIIIEKKHALFGFCVIFMDKGRKNHFLNIFRVEKEGATCVKFLLWIYTYRQKFEALKAMISKVNDFKIHNVLQSNKTTVQINQREKLQVFYLIKYWSGMERFLKKCIKRCTHRQAQWTQNG